MRRAIGVVLALSVPAVSGLLLAHPLRAASGPSNAYLPDFATSSPYAEQAPSSTWGLWATSGGLNAGDTIVIGFEAGGHAGDSAHAVAFNDVIPASLRNDIQVGTPLVSAPVPGLPSLPALSTGPAAPSQAATPNCTRVNFINTSQVTADPYSQTVSITVEPSTPIAPGTTVAVCFGSSVVGFPITAGDYSMAYSEPHNSPTPASVSYSVNSQSTGNSHQYHVMDLDGKDATNAGIGSPVLTYGVTYQMTLVGQGSQTYPITPVAFMASPLAGGPPDATVDLEGTSAGVPPCSPGPGTFCTDITGKATGFVRVTSKDPLDMAPTVYVSIRGTQISPEKGPSQFSISVGPPGAHPPTSTPAPPPTPTPVGNPGHDAQCFSDSQFSGIDSGLADSDVYTARNDVFTPAFAAECPKFAGLVSLGQNIDRIALADVNNESYQFAGLDRPLTVAETGSNPISGINGQYQQFPMFLEPLVITYNLPTDSALCPLPQGQQLKISGLTLAHIMAGAVTRWNDTQLQADNAPQVGSTNSWLANCNLPILVAHDTGQPTAVLKDYISKHNPAVWGGYAQGTLSTSWPPTAPVSCTSNGSAAMALCVASQPGMIGYGWYHDIHKAGLPIASVDNGAHQFFSGPVLDGCTTAAGTDPAVPTTTAGPSWSTLSITDWAQGYPICTFEFFDTLSTYSCGDDIHPMLAFLAAGITPYTQGKLEADGYAPLPTGQSGQTNNVTNVDAQGFAGVKSC